MVQAAVVLNQCIMFKLCGSGCLNDHDVFPACFGPNCKKCLYCLIKWKKKTNICSQSGSLLSISQLTGHMNTAHFCVHVISQLTRSVLTPGQ